MDYVPITGVILSIFSGNLDQGLIFPSDPQYPVHRESATHMGAIIKLNITSPLKQHAISNEISWGKRYLTKYLHMPFIPTYIPSVTKSNFV